jgi:hypothetical protein
VLRICTEDCLSEINLACKHFFPPDIGLYAQHGVWGGGDQTDAGEGILGSLRVLNCSCPVGNSVFHMCIVFVILHVIPIGKVVYHKALIQFQQECLLRR